MFNLDAIRGAFGTAPAPQVDYVTEAAEGRVVIVDVRGHDEVAQTGKAKGAVHIPLTTLQFKADPRHPECHPELKSGRPVALYCASGARSGMAAQVMRQLGHAEVSNLGGLGDWMRAGGAIER